MERLLYAFFSLGPVSVRYPFKLASEVSLRLLLVNSQHRPHWGQRSDTLHWSCTFTGPISQLASVAVILQVIWLVDLYIAYGEMGNNYAWQGP